MTTIGERALERREPRAHAFSTRIEAWCVWGLIACFGASLLVVYLSSANEGLWDDGYFAKRFAHNLWRYHAFSWNVEDGPVYGMTSQTLQVLATALYRFVPNHMVVTLKVGLYAGLFLAVLVLARLIIGARNEPVAAAVGGGAGNKAAGVVPCVVLLSLSLVLQVVWSGLETTLALFAVALALLCIAESRERRSDAAKIIAALALVYLTRPDAVLIPGVVLVGQLVLALRRHGLRAPEPRFYLATLLGFALALSVLLAVFALYYGTALPLPFYVKTQLITEVSERHAVYAVEKYKNATQATFFCLPFLYIALHARSKDVVLLLGAALTFFAYHYLATIETMGYLSRFYLPAFVPVAAAAGLAYRTYLLRRRWLLSIGFYGAWVGGFVALKRLDVAYDIPHILTAVTDVPVLAASGIALLAPRRFLAPSAALIGACLLAGSVYLYPIGSMRLQNDEDILLAQIRPRYIFRGLEQLRAIDPKVVYHTDMGAPGALLPNARVVDLDGLLNEDVTLRGASFDELCLADRPDALFVSHAYPELRQEILAGDCIRDYRPATPMADELLFIREDRLTAYHEGGH